MAPSRRPAHRAVRPRYGRVLAALVSIAITTTAILGAVGVLSGTAAEPTVAKAVAAGVETPTRPEVDVRARAPEVPHRPEELPVDSGKGRRVVFDMRTQRVWLVDGYERVRRTYLVSGSLTDNLGPGTYEVYSASRHAVGVDDSGTMEYMVRFAHGERAPIGFHDIPVKDGEPVQSRDELGAPRSHGCIRQWRPDARALWRFAKVGTTVVVTA